MVFHVQGQGFLFQEALHHRQNFIQLQHITLHQFIGDLLAQLLVMAEHLAGFTVESLRQALHPAQQLATGLHAQAGQQGVVHLGVGIEAHLVDHVVHQTSGLLEIVVGTAGHAAAAVEEFFVGRSAEQVTHTRFEFRQGVEGHFLMLGQHESQGTHLGYRLGGDLDDVQVIPQVLGRTAILLVGVMHLHQEVSSLVDSYQATLLFQRTCGGPVGHAHRNPFKGLQQNALGDLGVFLNGDQAGAIHQGFQQSRAHAAGDAGDVVQIQVRGAFVLGAAFQHLGEDGATLFMVRQTEINLQLEATQHGLVHFHLGVVKVGRHNPDHIRALFAVDPIQQGQQGGDAVVFVAAALRFPFTAGHQGFRFVQEDDGTLELAGTLVKRL